METMVATVLIVVLFMMSSLLLNTIFSANTAANNKQLTAHLQLLEYQYKNGVLSLPYYEELDDWNIAMEAENNGATSYLSLEATNIKTNKKLKTYSALAE